MRATGLAWLAVAVLCKFSLSVVQAQVAADYLVTDLPGLSPEDSAELKQYAGHIALDAEKLSNLFFWLVSSKHQQNNNKLIIWLNGGPGCSSADGYFLETGPLRFVDKKLTINKGGWHEFANVVFLDQPVGTGLSYTSEQLLRSLPEIKDHLLAFLKAFFAIFPERAKDDLYIAGESYAGTYIPYFAKGILDHNANVPAGEIVYNLKGLAIGNGWIDPLHQYTSVIPYAEHHGIASPDLLAQLAAQQTYCLDDIRAHDVISQPKCEQLVQLILDSSESGSTCLNQYDIRLRDSYPSCGLLWPYELPLMAEYLRRDDVKKALHATNAQAAWIECNPRVSHALQLDTSAPAVTLLPEILEKANVLLFSGEQDLICNHIGTEYLIANLTWQGEQGFQNAPKLRWTVDNTPAGVWRQERNMTYVLLYNASHMVPYDVPLAALDMMNRFMGLDPKLQAFTSNLETITGDVPPGGQKVDMPNGTSVRNGSTVLVFVIFAVGVGILVAMKNRQQTKNRDDGAQWFPLNRSGANQGHEALQTDELDELVVESGLRDDSDDEDMEDNAFDSHRRYGETSSLKSNE
ncbi:MAG: pheromone-processing carboxypeptidase kex1 [Benniella sp.]|nr:MAG: pheromone-processing carboxypeptidase kex1 [Benniella sp.]